MKRITLVLTLVAAFVLVNIDPMQAQLRQQNTAQQPARQTPASEPQSAERKIVPVPRPVAQPKSWAVLVGVNNYIKLANLRYCVNDIKAIEASLLQTGFNKENVFTLTTGAAEKDLPMRNNIVQIIQLVCRSAGPDDIVFIALNGHGVQIGDVQYFCPSDMDDQEDRLEETAVSIEWIYKTLEDSQAKFKVLVVDACRDNPFGGRRSALVADMKITRDPPLGIALLRSCGPGETSLEDSNFKKGIFTHFFLEGLTVAADMNGDGMISFLELYMYTQDKAQAYALQTHRSSQKPYIRGEFSDFTFVKTLDRVEKTLAQIKELFDSAEQNIRAKQYAAAVSNCDSILAFDNKGSEAVKVGQQKAASLKTKIVEEATLAQIKTLFDSAERNIKAKQHMAAVSNYDSILALDNKGSEAIKAEQQKAASLKTKMIPPPSLTDTRGLDDPQPDPNPKSTIGWTELGKVKGTNSKVYRDNKSRLVWTVTLRYFPSSDEGKQAKALVERYGFRLPTVTELQDMEKNGGFNYLDIKRGTGHYYETSNSRTLLVSPGSFRQLQARNGEEQRCWVIGVRNSVH